VVGTDGDYFDVTGTTNFAAMTVAADRQFTLQFDGALTMTHHATNLDLPGEANITTAAGDVAVFQSTGANTVQCISYTKADGTAVASSGGGNKTIYLPSTPFTNESFTGNGWQGGVSLADATTDRSSHTWYIPDDLTSITSALIIMRSDGGAGNIYAAVQANLDADGEAAGTDSDTIAATTWAVGAEKLDHLDITAALNGLSFDQAHKLGLVFDRQGGNASDTINANATSMGVVIVYA
jgi:hypothetical protein